MRTQPGAIFNAVARSVRRNPNRRAVTYRGRDLTYAALEDAVLRAARRLDELAIRPGDRVAFLARNSDAYLVGRVDHAARDPARHA